MKVVPPSKNGRKAMWLYPYTLNHTAPRGMFVAAHLQPTSNFFISPDYNERPERSVNKTTFSTILYVLTKNVSFPHLLTKNISKLTLFVPEDSTNPRLTTSIG